MNEQMSTHECIYYIFTYLYACVKDEFIDLVIKQSSGVVI